MEVVIAHSDELEPGACRSVSAAGYELLLFRHSDGAFSVLKDCCTHAEVALSGGAFEAGVIECPAHGARFDARTGRHLCMPAVKGVQAFEVLVRCGDVIVVLPDEG